MPDFHNPCARVRIEQSKTQEQFANLNRVRINAIHMAEAGCYTKPLPLYAKFFEPEDYNVYQLWRTACRKENFPEPPPVLPIKLLLAELKVSAYKLSKLLCVNPGEVHRLVNTERTNVPSEIIRAFKEIGWSDEDIRTFSQEHYLLIMER